MAARRRYEGAISILSILVCSLELVLFFDYNHLLVTCRLGKTLLLEKLRKYRRSLSGRKPEATEGKCVSNNFVVCRTFRQTRGCMVFRGFVAAFEQCKIPKPRPHPTRRRDQGVQQVKVGLTPIIKVGVATSQGGRGGIRTSEFQVVDRGR